MSQTGQEVMIIARQLANSGALYKMDILSPSRWSLGLHVLLVEDDEADAYLIRRALAKNPRVADVVIAEDGVEALELFDKRRIAPDLAIVDLHMPRKDGLALLKEFATRTVQFPSVVLTSSKASKDAIRAAKRGAVEFITKPRTEGELAATLDRIIRNVL
jgi:CheY-like chemotaxis protein